MIKLGMESTENGIAAVVDAIRHFPFGLGLMIYCFFLVWSVGGLTCFHWYLAFFGITTNEEMKGLGKKRLYDMGCVNNYLFVVCGPWFSSYLDLRKIHFDPNEPLGILNI